MLGEIPFTVLWKLPKSFTGTREMRKNVRSKYLASRRSGQWLIFSADSTDPTSNGI
jgi:hypothetical protein